MIIDIILLGVTYIIMYSNMKKIFFLLTAILTFQMASAQNDIQADQNGYIVYEGDKAPDFQVTLTNGQHVRLSDLRGKLVMLQFTASWCGVCRKEMPFIESDIWQPYRQNSNFFLVGIDRDEPLEKVLKFAETTKVTYPLALDPGADVFARYAQRQSGVTRNVLIDANGIIIQRTRLYEQGEFQSLVETIKQHLDSMTYTTFNTMAFQRLLASDGAALLDVRTENEYKEGHLPHARLINVMNDDFLEKVKMLYGKNRPLAVYCRSGRRSAQAAQILSAEGYHVYNLDGGILQWEKDKGEITQ